MTKEIDEEAKCDRQIFKKRMEALGDKILREEREENERREKDEYSITAGRCFRN